MIPILMLCVVSGMVSGQSAVLPGEIWDASNYDETGGDSEEPMELLYAALHYFDRVNADGERASQDDVKRSLELVNRAYRNSRRRDPVITTMYSMISLWGAGKSDRLRDKIRYSTQGINGFENARALAPGNLEVKELRLVSCVEVPPYFNDLTAGMIADGEVFLNWDIESLNETERAVWESYLPRVAVVMAECMSRRDNSAEVRRFLTMIPPGALDDPSFSGLKAIHESLVEEWL